MKPRVGGELSSMEPLGHKLCVNEQLLTEYVQCAKDWVTATGTSAGIYRGDISQ